MNDLEISKALALAIGYDEHFIHVGKNKACYVVVRNAASTFSYYRVFDYRDWNVIGPIAAKYDLFPRASGVGWYIPQSFSAAFSDTPQKAIALAVIEGAKT